MTKYLMNSGGYMSENETSLIDRKEIYKMIDEDILKYVDLSDITIKGNKVEITTAPTE